MSKFNHGGKVTNCNIKNNINHTYHFTTKHYPKFKTIINVSLQEKEKAWLHSLFFTHLKFATIPKPPLPSANTNVVEILLKPESKGS